MAELSHVEQALKHTLQCPDKEGVRESADCRIAVIGVGGAGNRTVSRLVEIGLTSAECMGVDTDVIHLNASKAGKKILLGKELAKGFGVRGDSKLGKAALEESKKTVEDLLSGVNIVFVTAGLGGGTGAGAAPIIAEIAKQKGAVTVGIVTAPFRTDSGRQEIAADALVEMGRHCDTLVVIDSKKLAQQVPQLPIREACQVADQALASMIKDIVETILTPSLVNLDFGDFKTVVCRGGVGVVGVGESDTPNRAEDAVRNALRAPLWDVDFAGATGALVHVAGDNHMTVEEVNRVGEIVTEMMHDNAHVIWGAKVNPQQEGKLKVTLLMTGVNSAHISNGLGTIAPQLFDLEPHQQLEKPLDLKLDIYQMESF